MTPQHTFDPTCAICNSFVPDPFDDEDEDFDPFDEADDQDDDLSVDFVFDHHTRQLVCIHTGGLWRSGLPELYIRPPRDFSTGGALPDAQMAVFLALGLTYLGQDFRATRDREIPPYSADLDGRRVQFWLADQERPFKRLVANLGPQVDAVIRVDCSLWHPSLLGDGRTRIGPDE